MKRSSAGTFQDFYSLLQSVHQIPRVDVLLGYTDVHGDLLPINNDDNYHKALSSANPLLRVIIQKKGQWWLEKGWDPFLGMCGASSSPHAGLVPLVVLGDGLGGGDTTATQPVHFTSWKSSLQPGWCELHAEQLPCAGL